MEGLWPEEVRRALAARGHQVEVIADWAPVTGGAQAIAVDETGVFSGGADPRREGYAAGY
jgi:gamma-glutamyltranspeptidase/glutathione hydrolase